MVAAADRLGEDQDEHQPEDSVNVEHPNGDRGDGSTSSTERGLIGMALLGGRTQMGLGCRAVEAGAGDIDSGSDAGDPRHGLDTASLSRCVFLLKRGT